jgi:TolB-like protein/DNA-binding winged helix-turn-helix (wHTH) protein/tetratricopeptide (TPR) repeat protein
VIESHPARTVIFGPFQIDPRSGELRKSGIKIKLQQKPFQLLQLLLEHPGELVNREELRQKLWPANTFVDFDHSVGTALGKLRQALGDSAYTPRFIETLGNRGYRFIAPVTELHGYDIRPSEQDHTAFLAGGAGALRKVPAKQRWFLRALAASGILLVGIAVGAFLSRWSRVQSGAPLPVRIQSLAVLPLENLSGDIEQEYFADGMTAELITELAKVSSLRVISRTSAMRYKRTRKPLEQIARELKVDAVVEGEVLNSGRRVRVTAQLIQTATDRHLWAETYERDLRDVVELQGEVAQSIATAIRTKVTPEEHARLADNRPVNPEAYEAYLKGRYFWNKRTESGLKKSIEYFQQSIQKDPGYALVYSGLADSYDLLAGFEFLPSKDAYSKAKAAANKALKLDDTLGEAHTVLGDAMYEMDWDWRGAEREFKRAIELNPGYATAHQRYSLFLMRVKRTEESLTEIRRAQAIDPLSLAITSSVGWRLLWARRYDEAIEQLQKTLEMDPNFGRTHMYLGWAYEAKGNSEKAIDELRKAVLSDAGSEELASLGHAYALGGYTRQAQNVLKQLEERSRRGYASEYEMAIVYAGLGEKDRAFGWLAKSCNNRDKDLVSLKADQELDNLRSDSRFRDLLRCVGLSQ